MATHSIILAQEIPWTEEHGGLQSMEYIAKESDTNNDNNNNNNNDIQRHEEET